MKYFTLILAFCVSLFAHAKVIDIHSSGAAKQSLSVSSVQASGTTGNSFLSTLRNDLLRAGWYRVTNANAQVNVRGTATGSSATNEALSVHWSGKKFAWNRTAKDALTTRKHAHELADAIVNATTGEKGIAQTRLAIVGQVGRAKDGQAMEDLYVCDYDGYNLKRLTSDSKPIIGPRWSADNRTIYFTSYRLGFAAVYKIDVATGKMERLANFRGLSTGAVPSPTDPNKLAIILSHQGNPELYVMDARTRHLTRLTTTTLAAEASPTWSPDGRQICYVSDEPGTPHLYIVDVQTKQRRRLTMAGGENVQPDWGENGILFATKRGCPYRIALIDPARGESSLRYLTEKNEQFESPSWAPNGRHVVTSRKQGRTSSIWIVDALEKGDVPYQPFNSSQGQWFNPAWSK
ncbi:MAG: DPP IV N-terminal domain-containing protein [bacterium]|nr:DPP IV N-terminal domain-containing protein [bacterium]